MVRWSGSPPPAHRLAHSLKWYKSRDGNDSCSFQNAMSQPEPLLDGPEEANDGPRSSKSRRQVSIKGVRLTP
uniref:Replication-associated protein n=1 Tax=Cressdnaviricota sp. TaxID=2748378 RepID=A0A6M3YNI0_9VIRU|nr:MAG: replication-associated protein [Cressdnaviricota sp.]